MRTVTNDHLVAMMPLRRVFSFGRCSSMDQRKMLPPILPLLKDPKRLVQRLKLYSKRLSPLRRPWLEDAEFTDIYDRLGDRTLASRERCFTLFELARVASAVPGDYAEVGVYRGGTAFLLSRRATRARRVLHLFDTFEGMPETDLVRDLHQRGDFADTSLEAVRKFVGEHEVLYYKGFFPGTAEGLTDHRFAFVHIDVDIARSVMDACEFFYPRMSPGGVMVFDDYGETSCPGATWAVDEFFESTKEKVQRFTTGQAVVSKLGS